MNIDDLKSSTTFPKEVEDAIRERIGTGAIGKISAPSTIAAGAVTNRYGGATNFLGDPVTWLKIEINGIIYKIPVYT